MKFHTVNFFVVGLANLVFVAAVIAQPDPSQMSGLPLPDADLPDGTISVRVIRGQLTNNVSNQPVDLYQGDLVTTAITGADGRATFLALNSGAEVYVTTTLDGQNIQSRVFRAPGLGGVRLMLVGTDDSVMTVSPSEKGFVAFGGESWIQVELGEETVEVYYLLQILNMAQVSVEPEEPIVFDLPIGAQSASVLSSSSSRTIVKGTRVELPGPFQPGATPLSVAYVLPYNSESLVVSQEFPVNLEALVMMIEKWGTMDIASEQITRRGDLSIEESGSDPYILASGPLIPAGEILEFTLEGLPHLDRRPTFIALILSFTVIAFGSWLAFTSSSPLQVDARKQRLTVQALKERLFTDLVKVERKRRLGKIGSTKYSTRRKELLVALEQVYRQLDEQPIPS